MSSTDPPAAGAVAPKPAAPSGGGRVVLRPFRLLLISWIGAVLIAAVFAVIAVLLPQTPTGVNFRTVDQVAVAMLGLFIAGGVLLVARPRVRADAAGIEVRNILLSRYLPWDQVLRVAFPDGASWARLDLPDDEYLPVMAIQAADGSRAVDGIRRVRALHARATGGNTGGAPGARRTGS